MDRGGGDARVPAVTFVSYLLSALQTSKLDSSDPDPCQSVAYVSHPTCPRWVDYDPCGDGILM